MYTQGNMVGLSKVWMPQNVTSGAISTTMPLQTHNVVRATGTANNYNQQLNDYLTKLNDLRTIHQQELGQYLKGNGTHDAYTYRQRAVDMAWKYEKADIEMGGRGSEHWNRQERQQILSDGRVQRAEGHHQQNVADHPTEQSNPDNIKFYRDKQQHLEEGHGGDFRNESDAPMTDKNQMLKDTNNRRLVGNELMGAGIAAVISFVAAFSISLIVAAAQDGITPETLKSSTINGGNGAIIGTAGYAVGRVVDNNITPMLVNALEKTGLNVTPNIKVACTMAITGVAIITIVSTIQFIRLKRKGYATKDALKQVIKQAIKSLAVLALSVLIQALFGNVVALVVGLAIGVIFLIRTLWSIHEGKKLSEKIQQLTADLIYKKALIII